MNWLEALKSRLGDDKETIPDRLKKAEKRGADASELVGRGPILPFPTAADKAKADIDVGTAAYRDLEDEPVMTRERFKKTVDLAKRGSKEAKTMLDRLRVENVEQKDPDALYEAYFTVKKKEK